MAGLADRLRAPAVSLVLILLSGCAPPAAPAAINPLLPPAPTGLRISLQTAHLNSNDIELSWTVSPARSYRVAIGTNRFASDITTVDVEGGRYLWTGVKPRAEYFARVFAVNEFGAGPASSELQIISIDLRDVIDALLFNRGDMADDRSTAESECATWPDGSRVRVILSREVPDAMDEAAQRFIDSFATLTHGGVTGFTERTEGSMVDLPRWIDQQPELPADAFRPLTVGVRVLADGCPSIALGCIIRPGGNPSGGDISLITLPSTNTLIRTLAHELGHAYGLAHLNLPFGTGLGITLMNGPRLGQGVGETGQDFLSPLEMEALRVARAAGIKRGTRRSTARALGVVN